MTRAVLFGDSITAGALVQEDERYMAFLEKEFEDIEFINKGISGNTSSDGRFRFETDVMALHPDICVIFFGMNDTVCDDGINTPKVTAQQFQSNLHFFIERLTSICCRIILCTINPVIEGDENSYYYSRHPQSHYQNPSGINAWIRWYSDIVRKIAKDYNLFLADVNHEFQAYTSQGGSLQDLLVSLEDYHLDDGVHPNPKGHQIIAHLIGNGLKDMNQCKE